MTELLGDTFDLEFTESESPQLGDSPEEVWTLFVTGFGPVKSLAAALDDDRREQLHRAFVGYYDDYTDRDGRVSSPREYVVIIGHRR